MSHKIISITFLILLSCGCAVHRVSFKKVNFEKMTLKEIHFDFDGTEISQEDSKTLGKLALWLKKHPQVVLVIEGHADSTGPSLYNLILGDRRARVVKASLSQVEKLDRQLVILSHGELSPRAGNQTKKGRAENRRVELKPILGGHL